MYRGLNSSNNHFDIPVTRTSFRTDTKWRTTLFDSGAQCLDRKSTTSGKKRESPEPAKLQAQLEKTQNKLFEKHQGLPKLICEHIRLKNNWALSYAWVQPDIRDQIALFHPLSSNS